MQYKKQKELIKEALSKVVIRLKGKKSNFIFCSENDISTSILSNIEHCKKDPQLTTIFRLAEAFNMPAEDFIKMINDELPNEFHFIDK